MSIFDHLLTIFRTISQYSAGHEPACQMYEDKRCSRAPPIDYVEEMF